MRLTLDSKTQKLIFDRIARNDYATVEEAVTAALDALDREERSGAFDPTEWDALIADGECSGEALDGEAVLAELRALRERRNG